ncbi:MAG: chemoreceptor glutamine deamidase CheD [Spirochaetaceae bacterium]|nr:chemoreceptor glutamine deamidase CheD [Spirochaetaceae bacterium]
MSPSGSGALVSRGHVLPAAVPGFEDIERYWDPHNEISAAKILPGEFYVTRSDELIVTVLGSCVSACIRDLRAGVGGMNHFMLPGGGADTSAAARYGAYAMETLLNELFKLGATKRNLEIKLTGGGRIGASRTDVGQWNIDFVRKFLTDEGLDAIVEDLGGRNPRKVLYFAKTGKLRVLKIRELHNDTLQRREQTYEARLKTSGSQGGDVELF